MKWDSKVTSWSQNIKQKLCDYCLFSLFPRDPITFWEWKWNLNTLLRRWLYTPIILWQGDWIRRGFVFQECWIYIWIAEDLLYLCPVMDMQTPATEMHNVCMTVGNSINPAILMACFWNPWWSMMIQSITKVPFRVKVSSNTCPIHFNLYMWIYLSENQFVATPVHSKNSQPRSPPITPCPFPRLLTCLSKRPDAQKAAKPKPARKGQRSEGPPRCTDARPKNPPVNAPWLWSFEATWCLCLCVCFCQLFCKNQTVQFKPNSRCVFFWNQVANPKWLTLMKGF